MSNFRPIEANLETKTHPQIQWTCHHCSKNIHHSDGYLHLSYADLQTYEQKKQEWSQWVAEQRPPVGGLILLTAADYEKHPGRAQWGITHADCDPDPDSNDYWIPLDRVTTFEQLLARTAHLMGKKWLLKTNWKNILQHVVNQTRKGNTQK